MSKSSQAVLKALELIWPYTSCTHSLSISQLSFEQIELIRQQNLASRRAYSHVHIPSPQQFPCFLQGIRCCGTAKTDATELTIPTDQVFQFRGAIHAGQPLQRPKAEARAGRSPAVRSSRPGETGTLRAPLLSAGVLLPVTERCRGKRGDDQPYACRLRIASQNVTRRRLFGVYRIVSQEAASRIRSISPRFSVFGVFLPNAACVA